MPLWFSRPKLVKVTGYSSDVPPGQPVEVSFSREDIDHGGYFDPGEPARITIPGRLGGWYLLLCTIRWMVPEDIQVNLQPDPVAEMQSYFYSFVELNGIVLGNDARQTANRTTGAKGTWHVMATETALAAGDVLKLIIWHCFDPAYIARIDAECHLSLRRIEGVTLSSTPVLASRGLEDEGMRR